MMNVRRLQLREIIVTAFYSGYCPFAPGTAGTVVGVFVYILEYLIFREQSWMANAVIVLLMLYPSIKIGDYGEKFFGRKDPAEVVLDEVMGYWISVLFFPFNWKIVILAFIIFRLFDIIKPFPIGYSQRLKGGLGIMADDYIAGICTNIILRVLVITFSAFGYSLY